MGSITRRDVVFTGSALATLTAVTGKSQAADRKQPNIIFILADDMGEADLSCYGAPQIKTPAIDRIAQEGAKFTQAYANSAVCTASRVGIITGRYQYRLAVGLEEPLGPSNDVGLPPEQPTIPSLLKKAGYETYLVGKWHMGFPPKFGPLKSGYDHFYGFNGGAADYFTHGMMGRPDFWDDATPLQQHGYLTDLLGQRAVDVVRAHQTGANPFFMSLHFNAPHWPWEGPGDETSSSKLKPFQMIDEAGTLATYNQMVEAMDRQVGLVLDALEQTGQAGNTIVLFTSDNGGERFSTTWPFNGRKSELLEGGIRVPSVIRWPGRIPAGLVSDQVTIHMDWLPTLVAAAGTKPDRHSPSDGINLLPWLTKSAKPVDRTLFWRFKGNAQRAVRQGDYKALKIAGNTFLFNVVEDPMERANLKHRFPDTYKRLTDAWSAWNTTMLAETPHSMTYNNAGTTWADHINSPGIDVKAIDDGGPWPPDSPQPGAFGPPG